MNKTFYIKQYQGCINPPCLPGLNCEPYPYTPWIDEDELTIEQIQKWTEEIEKKDRMSSLVFKERFIKWN